MAHRYKNDQIQYFRNKYAVYLYTLNTYLRPSSPVFVTLTCAFRYGREDLDVLGLSFRKNLFVSTVQVFPRRQEDQNPLSHLQEKLMKKLGPHAHPFTFSVSIGQNQPQPGFTGKLCGKKYNQAAS